jgi:hypothetical protein
MTLPRSLAALAALLMTLGTAALAREPGIGPIVPAGASLGVPIAANPPPGLFFSLRNTVSTGQLKDDQGRDGGVDLALRSSLLQLHYTPGLTLLGGDFRAMLMVPLLHLDQTTGAPLPPFLHGSMSGFGLGDIGISPFNLSWMTQPGVFWTIGTSINLPSGKFDANGLSYGTNVWGGTLEAGYSDLRFGWNKSAHLVYSTQATNKDTSYTSGDELLLNLTAMKTLGSYSLGPVAYWRKQIADDANRGSFYGGATAGRAEQIGLGLGYARQMAGGELNINLFTDVVARNTLGSTSLQVNFSIPLGARKQ